jgi:hypothetical protein
MARKQDKLRPYRVDYFNIDEMKDNDLALVRSVTARAVTAAEAATKVLTDNEALPIVLIRSYRFYKQITHKKDVFKPVEELFSEKNALIVMDEVEKYRVAQTPVVADHATPDPAFGVERATFYKTNSGTQVQSQAPVDSTMENNGHQTRFSDSSLYDEVYVNCGATDTSGKLEDPCPNTQKSAAVAAVARTAAELGADPQVIAAHTVDILQNLSGPTSPATVAAVADLKGMLAHDAHEQAMDTFVPTPGQPDISKYVDKTALPPDHPDHVCTDKCYDIVVLNEHGDDIAQAINDPMPGAPNLPEGIAPLWQKVLLFSGALVVTLVTLYLILHR